MSEPVNPYVLFEVSDRVAVITVARAEKLNALNAQVVAGIDAAISEVAARAAAPDGMDAMRCLIITGAGEKAFIAGADIGELAKLTPIEGREHARRGQALLDRIERLPIPSIAAINGFAYGGGLELAMACTLRVASENAKMGLPETSLGIIPGYGGTQRLARLVGTAKAYELVLTSDKGVTAADAERIGLVNRVVPAGQALAAAHELAKKIAANGPAACRYALDAIRSGIEMPAAEGLLFESTLFGLLAATADMKEGMTAFLEKRPARFTGK